MSSSNFVRSFTVLLVSYAGLERQNRQGSDAMLYSMADSRDGSVAPRFAIIVRMAFRPCVTGQDSGTDLRKASLLTTLIG